MGLDFSEHHEGNEALVRQRVELGDAPQIPRPLDHLAIVPRKYADALQVDLVAAGFRIDGVTRRFRRATIEFSRIDAADLGTADAFTREILDLVDQYDGEYDGWGGYLAADPEAD